MNKRIVLLVVLLLLGQYTWAQSTRVKGKVTDAKTGEVLPLVNVFFTGTTIGMTTDFDGEYYLETREEVTELQASFVGYLPKTVKINKGAYNAVDFQLEPQTFDLDKIRHMRSSGMSVKINTEIILPGSNNIIVRLIPRWSST